MAERRMFTKKITESDEFLDMPMSAQCLYFHLNMEADDDGFVNNPKKIIRMIGAHEDDYKLLVAKQFVLMFESGVIVIKHWKLHNYIQSDRYHPTLYQDEKKSLKLDDRKTYQFDALEAPKIEDVSKMDTECIQDASKMDTEVRLGKVRLGKVRDKAISPEPSSGPPADVEAIPLNDRTEWTPTEDEYKEWCRLYPGVDVRQQFREMRSWSLSNPSRKKTKSGVKRFVNIWLAKEQNRSRRREVVRNDEGWTEANDPLERYGYSGDGGKSRGAGSG